MYTKQAIRNFLEWGTTEIVGKSPLAMRLMELHFHLNDAVDNDAVNDVQKEAAEYYEGLSELRRQRRAQMGRLSNGILLSRDPDRVAYEKWLKNPSNPLPKSHREWALKFISKGENYG